MVQELYGPIVARLGFEYSAKDDADTSQLRTRAIEQAAAAQDPKCVPFLLARTKPSSPLIERSLSQGRQGAPGPLRAVRQDRRRRRHPRRPAAGDVPHGESPPSLCALRASRRDLTCGVRRR